MPAKTKKIMRPPIINKWEFAFSFLFLLVSLIIAYPKIDSEAVMNVFAALSPLLFFVGVIFLFKSVLKTFSDEHFIVMLIAAPISYLMPYSTLNTEVVILNKILRLKDNSFFENDFYMATTSSGGAYNFFAKIYSWLPMSFVQDAFYVSWLFSFSIMSLVFYLLLKHLILARKPAITAIVVSTIIVLPYTWGTWGEFIIGTNDLIYPFFRNQTLALTIGLLALFYYFRGRYYIFGLLMGIVLNLHINTGQHLLILIAFDFLFFNSGNFIKIVKALFISFIVSGPTNLPILFMHINSNESVDIKNPFILIGGYFRNPHHVIYSSWSTESYLKFMGLLAVGLICWILKKDKNTFDWRMLSIVIVSLIFQFVGYFFVEIYPIDLVALTQLSRMTIFIKVVFSIYIVHFIVNLAIVSKLLNTMDAYKKNILVAAVVAIAILLPFSKRHHLMKPQPNKMESFFLNNTSKDSLILIPVYGPPHFTSRTQRSVVVDFNRLPVTGTSYIEYYKRIMTILKLPVIIEKNYIKRLKRRGYWSLYHSNTYEDIMKLELLYGFDYVLRSSKFPGLDKLKKVFQDNAWVVYETKEITPYKQF